MPTIHRILTTKALCLAAVVFSVFGWAIFLLSTARVHTLGLDGKICPCELADIRQGRMEAIFSTCQKLSDKQSMLCRIL